MKKKFFTCICGLILSFFIFSDLFAAQSVSIVKSEKLFGGEPVYYVTVDFGGSDDYDTHFIIGQKYAEAVIKLFKNQGGFEKTVSECLRESVTEMEQKGLGYKDVLSYVKNMMKNDDEENNEAILAKAEIEGMDSVLNSSRNGYSSKGRLRFFMFNENQLTANELYLLNILSNPSGSNSLSVFHEKQLMLSRLRAVYNVKNRGNRPDQVRESFLGCIFSPDCFSSQKTMISELDKESLDSLN